jgi:hypothetical protein
MSLRLEELLTLVGRLDDAPGFDTPRERFRRFLVDNVTTPAAARPLIEQCHHALDEQHKRALQDLIVLLGRAFGFETTFGSYAAVPGGRRLDGQWRFRPRVHIVIDVRTAQGLGDSVEDVARAAAETRGGGDARTSVLSIITPLYPGRTRLESAAASIPVPVTIVSLRAVQSLADFAAAGKLSGDDAATIFTGAASPDFVARLLEALEAGHGDVEPANAAAATAELQEEESPAFWLAPVTEDYGTPPEQLVELVIGKRRVFGVNGPDTATAARPGDWLSFYIAGKGIVGSAQVAGLATSGKGLRDAHRFRQLLQLSNVELHLDAAVAPDSEIQLRLRASQAGDHVVPSLVPLSKTAFDALRAGKGQAARGANGDAAATSAAGSR